jgi:uncharacterized membrane protein
VDPGATYDAWRVVSLSPWPAWGVGLLAAGALAAVGLAWWGLRREPRSWRRRLLVGLRFAAMACLLFAVLEPAVRLLQTARVKNRLAVLVDGSASMGFPVEAGGASRAAAASAYLKDVAPALHALEDRFTLEWHRFDRDLAAADAAALEAGGWVPEGSRTDLLAALRAVGGAGAGRKLGGVLVIGDGADNAELGDGPAAGPVQDALRALKAPVSAVAVGSGRLADVAVEEVKVDDFAFVRNTVTVEATLRASGLGAMEVPVVLRREGRVVAQTQVAVTPEKSAYPLQFSFAPDRIGQFVYTIAAPAYAGEAVTANNARSFALQVIRDRVRALLVVGKPSWDERFLRTLLRTDPNVDLISFFILRTPQDNPLASNDEISLIPFPVDEIFDKQLASFDVVIFQDFAFKPYQVAHYLPNIRRYVENGGAFVMIGGENSFGEGGYQASEIGDILPVEPAGPPPSAEPFRPRLTAEGLRHPVVQLAAGAEANQQAWDALPALAGLNVTRAKAGARVLLDHPHLPVGDGKNAPVLALGEYGRGRSMALTVDSSWYWSMVAAGEGAGGPRAYERLWANAIRWLVRDPELTPVKVEVASDEVEPGAPVVATVHARRSDYGPADGASLDVQLIEADTAQVVARQTVAAGGDGAARVELAAPAPGPYRVVAQASLDGTTLGTGEDAVAVRAASRELSEAAPRPDLLRAVAETTGGGFVEASAGKLPDLHLAEPEVVEVGRARDRPIWVRWEALLALALCVGGEWTLRRRWGYF